MIQQRPISKLLQKEYNCEHLRHSTTVSTRIVREADAQLLQIPANHPILLAKSINCEAKPYPETERKKQVIEYGVTRFNGTIL